MQPMPDIDTASEASDRRLVMTNCCLEKPGDSETYLRDLALALKRAGYDPLLWSPMLGEFADELRGQGLYVIDELATSVAEPDLLHCQSHDEALAALSRFPGAPGIYVVHDATLWQDEPPLHPRLLRYLAVDELCRRRVEAAGVDPERIVVVPYGVDLACFGTREHLQPSRPKRALILSDYASADDVFYDVARAACARLHIELDVDGPGLPAIMADPDAYLGDYDLVFAKGSTAIQAMAAGCAVILTDAPGLAGLVTGDRMAEWWRLNFGTSLCTRAHDVDLLCAEIERFDPVDVAWCSDWVRGNCSLDAMVAAVVQQYDQVLAEWDGQVDHAAELVALSNRLAMVGPLRAADESNQKQVEDGRNYSQYMWDSVGIQEEQINAFREQSVNLTAARDSALGASDAFRSALIAVHEQVDELTAAGAQARAERDAADAQRQAAVAAAKVARFERDRADAALERSRLERNMTLLERDGARSMRDAFRTQYQSTIRQRDAARAERDTAEAERFAAVLKLAEVSGDLAALRATRLVRLRAFILRSRVAPVFRALSRATRRKRAR